MTSTVAIARRYGFFAAMFNLMYVCLNRLMYFKVLKGMTLTLDNTDDQFLEAHSGFPGELVTGDNIRSLIGPETGITEKFVVGALQRGNWAYVLRDGQRVASYGWYSRQSVPIDEYFSVLFSDDYVYMYKGFTHRDYRGEKLHAYGMAHALSAAVDSGSKGLISYVEADNFASLRSCDRLGYKIFGTCIVLRLFGKNLILRSPSCKHFDFGVRRRGQ